MTLTIYEINDATLSVESVIKVPETFTVFPNPAPKGTVYFNREAAIEVFDMSGKLIHSAKKARTVDTSAFVSGVYLVKADEGIVKRIIVK